MTQGTAGCRKALVGMPRKSGFVFPILDYESVTLATDPEFMALLEKSRQSVREGRVYTTEEMRKLFEDDQDG